MPFPQLAGALSGEISGVSLGLDTRFQELRRRLIYALVGVGVACCVTFYYAQNIVGWLTVPLIYAYSRVGLSPQIVTHDVMTGFTLYMKVGLVAGAVALLAVAGSFPARTGRGSAVLARVRGIRLYIATAEAEQMEQNILIRPLTLYNGPGAREYVALEER